MSSDVHAPFANIFLLEKSITCKRSAAVSTWDDRLCVGTTAELLQIIFAGTRADLRPFRIGGREPSAIQNELGSHV